VKLPSGACSVASLVRAGGVVVCEAVVPAVEIAEKSRIAVQARKQAVKVGTFPGLYSFSPAFILL
jgi:hypothetical protein